MKKRFEDLISSKKMNKANKKGFTLIELIVVIAIMAILALVAVSSFASYKEKAETAKDQANLRQAYTAAVLVSSESADGTIDSTKLGKLTNLTGVTAEPVGGKIVVRLNGKSYDDKDFGVNFPDIPLPN